MNDERLKQLFDFDEADLYANRNGTLTEKQWRRLAQRAQSIRRRFLIGGFVFPVVFLGVCLCFTLFLPRLYDPRHPENLLVLAIPVLMFIGSCLVPVGGIMIARNFKAPGRRVDRIEGPINIVKVEYRSGRGAGTRHTRTDLHVGGEQFAVNSDVAGYVMQGDVYTVYYFKDANPQAIMSLELSSPN